MQTYDKLALGNKARELGFIRDAFEKMSRLSEILQFVNADRELSPLLALKGGTSINLTVFNLPRLSVDIDFDFAENQSKETTATNRERVSDLIGRHMASAGYTLREKSKRTHALDSFVYSYINSAGNHDNIKIEINYILRCHVLPTIHTTAQTSGAFPDFPVRTLSPIEIFASKIVALSDRAAARDLYDFNNMICSNLFSKPDLTLLRKCAVLYRAVAGELATGGFNSNKIEAITPYKVRTELLPMIRDTDRFDLQAARDRVTSFLAEYMILTENETQFLKQFSAGYYEPQLLFEDSDVLKRIKKHPMAIWRIQNIRAEQEKR